MSEWAFKSGVAAGARPPETLHSAQVNTYREIARYIDRYRYVLYIRIDR